MPTTARHKALHPILVMLLVILAAGALTYFVDAGHFARQKGEVIAGSYQPTAKIGGLDALFSIMPYAAKKPVQAAGIVRLFLAIPEGMVKNAALIFMVMMVGGMFGVLRRTGAIDAAVDRLIRATAGNVYLLVPVLMTTLALGSTFLGFISEYLVLIPIAVLVGERLGFGPIFAMATVGVAAKIGYATSITNPLALIVAQPLAHAPLFGGLGLRAALFVLFLAISIVYVLFRLRAMRRLGQIALPPTGRLSIRHLVVLLVLLAAAVLLIFGSVTWNWHESQISAYYIGLSLLFALCGGLDATDAADAFLDGLKSMVLAGLLIGLAGAVQIVLEQSAVLDSLIFQATRAIDGQAHAAAAIGVMFIEMGLGVLIPSTAGKAAVSIPILAPIGRIAGISGQVTVLAFILGNGFTNMVTPTSGMLLAYLAAARVGFADWLRFVLPLFAILLAIAMLALVVATTVGY